MSRTPRILVALLLSFTLVSVASAQDANYWSSAYGTRSQLLGGVVIGSLSDISATYYNPGALALTQAPELLLAGNAYQYQRVAVDNGAGVNRTLVASSIAAVPSLFAGEIPILDHDRLAYAFLTRRSMDMEIARRSTSTDASIPIANEVFRASETQLWQSFDEGWYGLTWSRKLSENWGIGVSPFVVVRSQRTRAALLAEGRNAADEVAVFTSSREFDYMHWSALARFGVIGVRDSLTFGATLTTPNLGIMGGGSTQYNTTLVDQTGAIGTIMGADYREELDADYRLPLGAGGGASYGWGPTRVHAAVDWNAEVPRYTVLETPDFIVRTPSGDSTVRVVVSEQLKSVLNWGVGLEHRFSPTLTGFASFHTDFSAREEGQAPGASITTWDLNHFAVGANWHVWRSDLAIGLSGSSASQKTPPLPPPPDGRPAPQNLETKELLLTVILGWKIAF